MKKPLALCLAFVWVLALSTAAFAAETKPPSPEAIVDRYVEKIGGKANLEKIKSRTVKGEFTTGDAPLPWTEYTQDGKKRAWILEIPNAGPMSRVGDGEKAWSKQPDGSVTEMEGGELIRQKQESAFRHSLNPRGLYELSYEKSEKSGDDTLHVLKAKPVGGGQDWFSFSEKTGLLVRYRAEWDSGSSTYEETMEDYRAADGVSYPFTRKGKVNDFEFTLKIKELKQNTPIDSSVFTKPKAD